MIGSQWISIIKSRLYAVTQIAYIGEWKHCVVVVCKLAIKQSAAMQENILLPYPPRWELFCECLPRRRHAVHRLKQLSSTCHTFEWDLSLYTFEVFSAFTTSFSLCCYQPTIAASTTQPNPPAPLHIRRQICVSRRAAIEAVYCFITLLFRVDRRRRGSRSL